MTVIDLPTRYQIGGSEAAAVLGCDPFVSATMLGARKLGLVSPQVETDPMRMGTALQSAHAELIAEEGVEIVAAPDTAFVHPEHKWWIGHPDAFAAVLGLRAPVELKLRGVTPDERTWLRDEIQAMHYLGCTGLEVALVSVLHGGYGGVQRTERIVERDESLLDLMQERYAAFLDLLRAGEVPEGDGSDSAREFYRARKQSGGLMRLNREQWGQAKQARYHAEREKFHKDQKEWHWQQVQAAMGDATRAISPFDDVVAEWSDETFTRLDSKRLKAELPELHETYSTPQHRRRWLTK